MSHEEVTRLLSMVGEFHSKAGGSAANTMRGAAIGYAHRRPTFIIAAMGHRHAIKSSTTSSSSEFCQCARHLTLRQQQGRAV